MDLPHDKYGYNGFDAIIDNDYLIYKDKPVFSMLDFKKFADIIEFDEDNDSDDFEEESDDEIIYSNPNPSNEYKKNFHKNLVYYPLNSVSRYSYKVFVIDSNMILDDESPKWIIDKPLLFDNVPIINAQLTLIISK
jgi:hypothetical protein